MPSGVPTFAKFGDKKRDVYLAALREGNHRSTSARSVGVSPELVRLYRNEHPEFAAAEEQAETEANGKVENALFQTAIGGNVTAQQVWLYNRAPDRWKDQRNLLVRGKVEDFTNEELLAILGRGRGGTVEAPRPDVGRNGHANGTGQH